MALPAECPICGRTGQVPPTYLGRRVRCPRCSSFFTVLGLPSPVGNSIGERIVTLSMTQIRGGGTVVLFVGIFSPIINGRLPNCPQPFSVHNQPVSASLTTRS